MRAIILYQALQEQKDGAGWILGKQYLRSATSIGSNIQEAQAGESRADFIHKFAIGQKEANESLSWLRLVAASGILPRDRPRPITQVTEELIAIITAVNHAHG